MHPLLKHIETQVQLNNQEFERFLDCFETVKFDKKEYVIQPGQMVSHQYFVIEGCLRTFVIDKDGGEHTIQFAVENWWVSDYLAYYKGSASVCTVQCLESVTLLKVSQQDLHNLFNELPVLETFFRKQLENAFVAFQTRILSNLNMTSEERYNMFIERYPNIEQRVKNYQIASYLGIAPESLSRLRRLNAK